MRIRATVAAVTGALAFAALAVPAAQADAGVQNVDKPSAAERFGSSASARSTFTATAVPTVSNVTVNAGKDIVVGTTNLKTVTVSLTASHASGVADAYIDLWHGSDLDNVDGYLGPDQEAATCTASSATTSTCKLTITADPQGEPGENGLYANALAGSWHVTAAVLANDGSEYWDDFRTTHKVQRLSKLTVNASPEPVKKGRTITVTGALTRANWDTHKYAGYTAQSVQLQFRKKGTDTYTTVKSVTSSSTGALKTTVTAATDGYFRYNFAGTSTTPAVKATGDFVDVQ
ncbi:calcium-binding protein [Streptomyces sp. NPDC005551]|uniref:calcium-binding protein n=1 Tax=unclassified Streptomyces TaxID=2593676 RepID=UPI0033E01AAF